MKKIQIIGLVLVVVSGVLSQYTSINESQIGVLVLAGVALVGVVLVVSEWFMKGE